MAFAAEYAELLQGDPDRFVFVRSPLRRAEQTAAKWEAVLRERFGLELDVVEDHGVIEIDHGSWHGFRVEDLEGEDAIQAAAYRGGDFWAKPADGESRVDLLRRCRAWLDKASGLYPDKIVVVFGHGTFQNGLETLLLPDYVPPDPAAIFSRTPGGSHLKRGFGHRLW
eukprot:TRINITY_DN17868_c0_g1_i9.p1 TRINITY_DN17868_c0_g1~~TRINITY_DN17868_c0_g1_i9.p1  ORF type:complete len:168 (-),score=32.21 TRINITY_DN17868_c0_g1_i9:123-626(-)